MSKATLEYDLSNEDDAMAFKQACAGRAALGALYDIQSKLRYYYKHKEITDVEDAMLDKHYEFISEALTTHGIDLEELYN